MNTSNNKKGMFFGAVAGLTILGATATVIINGNTPTSESLSKFTSGRPITSQNAASNWTGGTDNPYRTKLSSIYVNRMDSLTVGVLTKGVNMSDQQFKTYLSNLSTGITVLGKKQQYASDTEVQNILGFLVYEVNNTIETLNASSNATNVISDLANLINNTSGTGANSGTTGTGTVNPEGTMWVSSSSEYFCTTTGTNRNIGGGKIFQDTTSLTNTSCMATCGNMRAKSWATDSKSYCFCGASASQSGESIGVNTGMTGGECQENFTSSTHGSQQTTGLSQTSTQTQPTTTSTTASTQTVTAGNQAQTATSTNTTPASCGIANRKTYLSVPTGSILCANGNTASAVRNDGTAAFAWTCSGSNNTQTSCFAYNGNGYTNIVHGGGVNACNEQIKENYGYQKYTCSIGGGCALNGVPATAGNPSANPQHAGVCIQLSDWNKMNG